MREGGANFADDGSWSQVDLAATVVRKRTVYVPFAVA
jgi:hypothetical protein